jgi:hypothetical protein
VPAAAPATNAGASTSDAHAKHDKATKDAEPVSPHSADAGAPATTENAPGAAALLTSADARGGTMAPDEPASTTTDPALSGGAQPATTEPATAAAPTADSAPAPTTPASSESDDDAGTVPANGAGGLRAP